MRPDEPEISIDRWRDSLRRRPGIDARDVAELEDHLEDEMVTLQRAGLSADEAFLVAIRRLGRLDPLARELAREHSERLWKQLLSSPEEDAAAAARSRRELLVVVGLALLAALAIKAPELAGYHFMSRDPLADGFYARNLALFVLPLVAGYFVWKRPLRPAAWLPVAGGFVLAALFANLYPFAVRGATLGLTALHLPIALWLLVGVAYTGGRWREASRRMDFVRFSGELFLYYVLIAFGGVVLAGLTNLMFRAIGLPVEGFIQRWMLPCGAMGAVLVGAWLVEAKQAVIENMAPVLTRLFTPLLAAVLLTFLVTLVVSGRGVDLERDVLIAFDLLLALVLGLVLYGISARDPDAPAGAFDGLQLLLLLAALAVDLVALAAIAGRISEFGPSPNKVAALGENVVLLVNLGRSAWLSARCLAGRESFSALERWQTSYLPVYALWAAAVVVLFPPLFGFR